MSRLFALAALFATLAWASQDAPAAADHSAAPSSAGTEETALQAAEKSFKEASEAATKKMAALHDFKTTWEKMDPDSILSMCQKTADDQARDVSDKKQDLDQLMHRVQNAAAAPSKADLQAVKQSAHAMFEAEKTKVKLVQKAAKQLGKADMAKCRQVGEDAKQALRAVKQAARKLEAARKQSGQPEHVVEGEHRKIERQLEQQEHDAEHLREDACHLTEDRFHEVEHKVEDMADKTRDHAISSMEEIIDSCAHHMSKLQQESPSERRSSHSSSDSSSDKTSNSHDEKSSESSSSSKKSESSQGSKAERAKPQELAASLSSLSSSSKAMYLCMGLVFCICTVAMLMSWRGEKRVVGAQPLLLG